MNSKGYNWRISHHPFLSPCVPSLCSPYNVNDHFFYSPYISLYPLLSSFSPRPIRVYCAVYEWDLYLIVFPRNRSLVKWLLNNLINFKNFSEHLMTTGCSSSLWPSVGKTLLSLSRLLVIDRFVVSRKEAYWRGLSSDRFCSCLSLKDRLVLKQQGK